MRIATWNVNSLKARQEKVDQWLERAAPDILLIQETKLTDADAPVMPFAMAGYDLLHHGEGRWNGVAIATRQGMQVDDVVTNFGDGPVRDSGPGCHEGLQRGGLQPVRRGADAERPRRRDPDRDGLRAEWPRRRQPVLRRQAGLVRAARALADGDARTRPSRSSSAATSTSPRPTTTSGTRGPSMAAPTCRSRSARRSGGSSTWGLIDAYRLREKATGRFSWWDYRAGNFHKNLGMRIDHLLVTKPIAERVVAAEIDREARKGPPIPSDHAPVSIDLDEPGKAVRRRLGGCPRADRRADAATGLEVRLSAGALPDDRDPGHPALQPARRPDLEEPADVTDDLDLVAAIEPTDLRGSEVVRSVGQPDKPIADRSSVHSRPRPRLEPFRLASRGRRLAVAPLALLTKRRAQPAGQICLVRVGRVAARAPSRRASAAAGETAVDAMWPAPTGCRAAGRPAKDEGEEHHAEGGRQRPCEHGKADARIDPEPQCRHERRCLRKWRRTHADPAART